MATEKANGLQVWSKCAPAKPMPTVAMDSNAMMVSEKPSAGMRPTSTTLQVKFATWPSVVHVLGTPTVAVDGIVVLTSDMG